MPRTRRDRDPASSRIDALATAPLDDLDRHHLTTLATAAETLDPVPPTLVERVQFAVAVEELWTEVAEIQRQPMLAGAGVRGTAIAAEAITFTQGPTTLTIVLDEVTGRLDGWITPEGPHVVELRTPDTVRRAVASGGRFEFDGLEHGVVQVTVFAVEGDHRTPALVTSAFIL